MAVEKSDAMVLFGVAGDLAHKKIFPALQAMVQRGQLDVPVIGVARCEWSLEQWRARVRDSLETRGGVDLQAFAKLSKLLGTSEATTVRRKPSSVCAKRSAPPPARCTI